MYVIIGEKMILENGSIVAVCTNNSGIAQEIFGVNKYGDLCRFKYKNKEKREAAMKKAASCLIEFKELPTHGIWKAFMDMSNIREIKILKTEDAFLPSLVSIKGYTIVFFVETTAGLRGLELDVYSDAIPKLIEYFKEYKNDSVVLQLELLD